MKSTVGERGQVTIPKALRDSLAIRAGTTLDFVEENGALVARRVVAADAFAALLGVLEAADVDAALDKARGPAWNAADDEAT